MPPRAKRSLQVPTERIEQVKSALARNGYFSQKDLATEMGIGLSTVSNFLNGRPVSRSNFHELCDRLNLNWQDIAGLGQTTNFVSPSPTPPISPAPPSSTPPISTSLFKQDWGEAPDVSEFYGRSQELATLQTWIIADKCRLIALLGMGGIGKTALSVKLAKTIANQFDFVIWRSLRESPPVAKILTDLIKILSRQQETELPDSIGEKITKLIEYLTSSRCLLVLDNAESILQGGSRAGHYRPEYEDYGSLCQRVGSSSHQSCLLITSREKPKEIATLAGSTRPVRTLPVKGLQESAQEIIKAKGVRGSQTEMARLTEIYSGNPLAINIVATSIQDLFAGDLATFLSQDVAMLGDIAELLDSQFNRLPEFEQGIMYWLAINREPVSCQELGEDIVPQPVLNDLLASLEGLRRRSLIERVEEGFTLQNVVMEYMTGKLIAGVREEIIQGEVELFHRYALLKATAKDYVRETQIRLIVKPVVAGIRDIQARLTGLLAFLRKGLGREAGYGAGNVLNLLACLDVDLAGYDFSGLSVRQAYLQGKVLHGVNFAEADVDKCVFTKTFGGILSVAFSPDGRLVAAGDTNGEIRLWRVADGQPFLTLQEDANLVRSVVFSQDSKTLASGSDDETIKLWDVNSGQCLQILRGHRDEVRSVAFSPDGKTIVSGSHDHTIKLWDVITGKCLKTLEGNEYGLNSIVFSPDFQTLFSAGMDQTVKIWDVITGKCLKTLTGHTKWINSIAFSPNSQIIASGSADGIIKIWDTNTGECLKSLKNRSAVYSVAFSGDGRIASGDQAQKVKIWDVITGKCLQTLEGHTSWVNLVTFSYDRKTLASAGHDQTIKLWNCDIGECLATLRGHDNLVKLFAFSPDNTILASVSNEGHISKTVRLWNFSSGKCLSILRGHKDFIRSIVFSPNGQTIASAGNDCTIRLWNVNTGQCLNILQENTQWIWSVAFHPNGQILASANGNNTIKIWDVITGKCIQTLEGHKDTVLSVAFSPDGKTLCSGSRDKSLKFWQLETNQCMKTIEEHDFWVKSVGFSLDGKYFASRSTDHTVKLWHVNTGQCVKTLQGNIDGVKSLIFSPDGKVIATRKHCQVSVLWDINTGKELITLNGAISFALSPNGQILASDSEDQTIKIWDIKTGECLKTLRAPRPYEAMNITRITGISEAEKANLKALGAVEEVEG